ncbi:MAG TPA: hypothetical protein VMF69_04620 [Gemmataceae bacterium]|nr:hypothetical protein [Gemmataceae bacterium]
MNLLCPNCQKMLTVPEEFAGQAMKCPLCSGNFTVPGLPGTSPSPSAEPEPDIYTIRHEPAPPPPPPPLSPVSPQSIVETPATPTPLQKLSLLPQDYQHTLAASLNPAVLPWITPVCLLLIFFLQFFDWDGLYPGGVPAATANAWYAAIGKYPLDGDLKNLVPSMSDDKYKPGASVLTIFYLILFLPTLVVTIASVVLPLLQMKLPPQVEKLMPWRFGIVAAVNLILFFFLGLQVLLGFSLDSSYREWVDNATKSEAKDSPTTQERKLAEAHRGELLDMLHHTIWFRLVVLLHLIAIANSVLMFLIDRRGTLRPLPKLELRW